MGEQIVTLSTLVEFFAFALLVATGGLILLMLLLWSDEVAREFGPKLPNRERRRRAIIPLTKIA